MSPVYFSGFLVVLAILLDQFASAQQICIRELEYPHNGLCCNLCPPGFYKVKDCTWNLQTECAACADGYFLDHPNFETRCRRCTRCHSQVHEEEKTPCRKYQDRVCQCMQGYFIPRWSVSEVCYRHMKCPPGEGVDKKGTRETNTVCRPCAHGTFSDKRSSRQKCRRWTDCKQLGREEVEEGTKKHDAICRAKLTTTTQTVPSLKSTKSTLSTIITSQARSKPPPPYSVLPKFTMSMSTPLPNFTVASTTPTPSTSDFIFILKSSTASSSQPVSEMSSSPPKLISTVQHDIKTLSTKTKTTETSSSDQNISDFQSSSTHSLGTTTTAIVTSANGDTRADQKSSTSPSPAVTIMQPKTSVSYFIELIAKAKPATTPATYTLTETTEQREETKYKPDVRNNGVHGYALQKAMILILSCLLVITVIILAAIVIKFWCYKKKKNISLPTVYYNNTSGDVTIGEGSQDDSQNHLMGADGGSGSQDNNSDAVHSVEVHEANQMNTEDEHSPLMPALGGHPEAAASPSEDLDISEKELAKLARTMGPGWEAASIQFLDITRAQLQTCKDNNLLNRDMQIFDTLNLWKTNNKGKATLQTLCQLLTQAEVDYTVEEY
ncbi:PREDICTED: uncharacterized protein LOC109480133 isoform X2 [Branchiostoma belcheri]|uniref:Uncharacterized protein LOC109480133 isoform X2 n=1 Tax=Branchiostoma belcheri TaxID=7741 RepID=A0A6P4ZM47_BRABE|nr:PREDICTED: uncharacterized protein LOC109480133 isoform X2 [Branchiostoma belcheri]